MSKSTALVPGSLAAVAQSNQQSLAESFLSADCIILCDTSASMEQHDSRGGRSRSDVMNEELRKLQETMPGKLAVVSFSSRAEFSPGGVPIHQGQGTNLTAALEFVRMADGCVTFVVISDGEPQEEQSTLALAQTFESRIDTVYVGSETDRAARAFLTRLAKAAGGQAVTADRASDLAKQVVYLLTAGR